MKEATWQTILFKYKMRLELLAKSWIDEFSRMVIFELALLLRPNGYIVHF